MRSFGTCIVCRIVKLSEYIEVDNFCTKWYQTHDSRLEHGITGKIQDFYRFRGVVSQTLIFNRIWQRAAYFIIEFFSLKYSPPLFKKQFSPNATFSRNMCLLSMAIVLLMIRLLRVLNLSYD